MRDRACIFVSAESCSARSSRVTLDGSPPFARAITFCTTGIPAFATTWHKSESLGQAPAANCRAIRTHSAESWIVHVQLLCRSSASQRQISRRFVSSPFTLAHSRVSERGGFSYTILYSHIPTGCPPQLCGHKRKDPRTQNFLETCMDPTHPLLLPSPHVRCVIPRRDAKGMYRI